MSQAVSISGAPSVPPHPQPVAGCFPAGPPPPQPVAGWAPPALATEAILAQTETSQRQRMLNNAIDAARNVRAKLVSCAAASLQASNVSGDFHALAAEAARSSEAARVTEVAARAAVAALIAAQRMEAARPAEAYEGDAEPSPEPGDDDGSSMLQLGAVSKTGSLSLLITGALAMTPNSPLDTNQRLCFICRRWISSSSSSVLRNFGFLCRKCDAIVASEYSLQQMPLRECLPTVVLRGDAGNATAAAITWPQNTVTTTNPFVEGPLHTEQLEPQPVSSTASDPWLHTAAPDPWLQPDVPDPWLHRLPWLQNTAPVQPDPGSQSASEQWPQSQFTGLVEAGTPPHAEADPSLILHQFYGLEIPAQHGVQVLNDAPQQHGI
jgi:hypothetical protein